MNFRQIHLDFHTSEKIENIGEKFSKEQFQQALKAGHVDSITLFSKCHHGWAYHPSKANTQHPNLNFDLLKAEIEAAHEIGVKTPVYLSAGIDEKIARLHPEWLVRNKDESTTWQKDFARAGYHKFCLNSPYLDYLLAQIREVAENYDADGIFLDIVCVHPCYCQNCINTLLSEGKDPYDDKNILDLAERVYANYTKRVRETIDSVKPGLPVFHNGGHIRRGRRDLAHMNTHLELESLPTGGWGYDHFPLSAAYARTLGMEYLGMTGKFHTSWGEFGGFKHPNALRYEVSLAAANGACSSIGDQMHPSGKMDMETYNLIGEAYAELEEKEPWLKGAENLADIALLSLEAVNLNFNTGQSTDTMPSDAGAVRMLLEGKYLFDVIDIEADFEKYKVIILPDAVLIDESFKSKLDKFTAAGGKILATGTSGLDMAKEKFALDFGSEYIRENEYNPDYFVPGDDMADIGKSAYVMYSKGQIVKITSGKELATRENPYFNRTTFTFSSHKHTPNSMESAGSAITEGKDGIYIAWNVFEDYATVGSLVLRKMVTYSLDRLLADDKTVSTNLGAQGVVTLTEQRSRYVFHSLYVSPVKRGDGVEIVEDIIPLYNTQASVKTDKTIKRVYLAPQMEEIPYVQKDGRVKFTIPKIENHQMTVLEF